MQLVGSKLTFYRTDQSDFSLSAGKDMKTTPSYERNNSDSNSLFLEQDRRTKNGNRVEGNLFLQFLPIHVDCIKAAVVVGNENTRSVLIAKFDKASGEIDASSGRPLDQYRQLLNFKFEHPVVQIKPNDDYKEDQAAAASRMKTSVIERLDNNKDHVHYHSFLHRYRRKFWHKLQNLVPYFRSSVESFSTSLGDGNILPDAAGLGPNSNQWQGLSRYLDESEQDDKSRWSSVEYATVSTIVDSPIASMSYYWDIPGPVPPRDVSDTKTRGEYPDINGDPPPEWGLDLIIEGAMINYGPWADRQRVELQRVFFPSLCKDATPAKTLGPGQTRIATKFKLYIQLDDETTLRIPIREESKNWKWKRQADTMGQRLKEQKQRHGKRTRKKKTDKGNLGPEIRPFGWLDINVGANATITYCMDMIAGPKGFSNNLEIDIPNTEITTSVNHGLLWRSVDQHLSCDLSNPLEWNGLHIWRFNIMSNGLELFILREHIFLLIDLIDDWASGAPPEFLTFSPFRYLMNLQFGNFRLYLNVNDSNIINNPSDFDDNTFVIVFGTALSANICVPLTNFRPHRNDVSFDVKAQTCGLDLHVPPWNTQATFLTSTELANLKDLGIQGTYQYCTTTSTSNTDTLLLNVVGRSLEVQLYGFLVRYFLKLKDNYFGEDIRFKTLEEYQQILHAKLEGQETISSDSPPHKKSNDLDVILSINADNIVALLPTNLYFAGSNVRIETPNLALDLRFTNYYMDMELGLSPLSLSLGNEEDGASTPVNSTSSSQLFIDGVHVIGHRVFGLPPTEPTYVCNWDFDMGAITGECSADFTSRLAAGGRAFAFSFDDYENALPSISTPPLHDVTFLRASIEPIRVWLHAEEAAFLISTGGVEATFNDWAGSHYSRKTNLRLSDFRLACVDAESASRHRSRSYHTLETQAYVQTAINVAIVERKPGFAKDRLLQQLHIKREDLRTNRAGFLLRAGIASELPEGIPDVDPPAQCFPPLPVPLKDPPSQVDEQSSIFTASTIDRVRKPLRRSSSFLSTAGSSDNSGESIIRSRSHLNVHRNVALGESRSRSRQGGARQNQGTQPRDLSASTGRQSSFYSAVGDHGDRRGFPPSSVTILSSYLPPYFPLEAVEPDPKDLPGLLLSDEIETESQSETANLTDVDTQKYSEFETQASFIVELESGIRAFCNPDAVHAVSRLVACMEATSPSDMIDKLQMDSISEILMLKKRKTMASKCTDLNVRIPSIQLRFINSSPSQSTTTQLQEVDQYEFSIFNLIATARTTIAAEEPGTTPRMKESSLLHLQVKSASFSAKERVDGVGDPQAAINGGIRDAMLVIANTGSISGNLSLKTVEIATKSSKVQYMASLVHRTSLLAVEISDAFSMLGEQERHRLQVLAFLVATTGQHTSDPLFFTRPSYVLRSATDHLRINDSWKVIARLRHMYNSLEPTVRQDINMRCLNSNDDIPVDASQKVLKVFDQWRSWDLSNLPDSIVMQKVYGRSGDDNATKSSARKAMKMELGIGQINLLLDPGPKQNEVTVLKLAIRLTEDTPVDRKGTPNIPSASMHTTTVQVYCTDVSINLNWELCELVDDILKLYNHSLPDRVHIPSGSSPASSHRKQKPEHRVHIVIVLESGSITVDTINIRAVSITKTLKTSFIITEGEPDKGISGSAMIATEAATTKIRSNFQDLMLFQLRNPSVYVSYENQRYDARWENSWKTAANCEQLSLDVKQDALALLEVADLLIGDEIAQINHLIDKFPSGSLEEPKSTSSDSLSMNKFNAALFLDMYNISIPLLHSLTYNVSGVVARASVAARQGSDIVFDFDVKENSHDIQTQMNNKPRSVSLLQMPPTNGRVTSHMGRETSISVFASVEPIQFDAASIHSLLAALNRPEISSVASELRISVQGIQEHLEEVFGTVQKPISESVISPTPIIYDAHMTFAGLDVFADTRGGQAGHDTARLSFNIGCVHLEAANRPDPIGPILRFPDIHLDLGHIIFKLSRRSEGALEPCGNFVFTARLTATSRESANGDEIRSYHIKSGALEINLFAETASTVVDVMGHLQDRIKDLDLSREVHYLQKLRKPNPRISINGEGSKVSESIPASTNLCISMYSLEMFNIQIGWIVGGTISDHSGKEKENLVLSLKRIDLSTRKENAAKLTIEDLQLQMVPSSQDGRQRSQNSALLPEVVFNVAYVSTADSRRLAFQAIGKSLDLRLTSQFIIPAADLRKSIESASEKVRATTASWLVTPTSEGPDGSKRQPFFGSKRIESLLVDADFAGAMVHLQGKKLSDSSVPGSGLQGGRAPQSGRYGQFSQEDPSSMTVLRSPGLAWKVEFKDNGIDDPSLNAEVKISASSNILYPTVVPLILEISSSMKEIISDEDKEIQPPKASPQKFMSVDEDNILTTDPSAVLGRTRLNLGLRICTQEFSLSCQPIARVAATARFDDIYITINTVRSVEHGHFFAISAIFTRLQASVQHVYSRESTGSFDVDSIVLSLTNSKHVSGTSGVSAILKISPMRMLVNAKQLQDFLLFREIWMPPEIRQTSTAPATTQAPTQSFSVQRYQQVAATGAFPWNATVSIAELDVQLDLGQAIGKSAFMISNFWISSKKNSDWEQNLCLGFDKMGVDSSGRMSGFVALQNLRMRTSITWPDREEARNQTPLIQGSLGFGQFRVKIAFDYQAFLVANITSFEFVMYNVRNGPHSKGDRLVAILDGDSVQVFCTTTTASQVLALYQAFLKLVQEKRTNYETSLKEIERFMKRRSISQQAVTSVVQTLVLSDGNKGIKAPISLHTDVVVTLKAVNIGAFPSTFLDNQIFKLEALNAQARFAVAMEDGKIHSWLGLTLGQLRIGLAGVRHPSVPKTPGEISVEDVVESATGSRGGTILRVPMVEATMETWQSPDSNRIDYIFKSSFEGKVEVGWNYSRISYIRGMYGNHTRALAQRLGKPLPPSAVKITGVPDEEGVERKDGEQQKITAEVTVPQSKYEYIALEPPIIETPQLRDMGEATPPLEWIGLHRDRLPNLTHQIVIVTLLELASEVEDAYTRILGSS
jgi:hypothetical protein